MGAESQFLGGYESLTIKMAHAHDVGCIVNTTQLAFKRDANNVRYYYLNLFSTLICLAGRLLDNIRRLN